MKRHEIPTELKRSFLIAEWSPLFWCLNVFFVLILGGCVAMTGVAGGIAGFFGGTKEQCFDINIPETRIEYALIGGGTTEEYLLESNLEKGKIKLNVPEFKVPSSLEELQYNYGSFEQSGVDVSYG